MTDVRPATPGSGSPRRFQGQVALVTGGASGIGAATVDRLAAEGAAVWIADVDLDGAQARAARLPRAQARRIDVTDSAGVAAVVAEIVSATDRLDVVVANAGITLDDPVWRTSDEDLGRVVDVNLLGAFRCAREALRVMVERRTGAVVFTASDAGLVGWPGQAAYCASKGGVVALTRAAAMDAAPFGVRVNCVCPGFTATPLAQRWIEAAEDPEAAWAEVARTQPLGRMAEPAEVAAAIAFLASDESRFVTGVALPVDGGVTAR